MTLQDQLIDRRVYRHTFHLRSARQRTCFTYRPTLLHGTAEIHYHLRPRRHTLFLSVKNN